jgi:mannose/fructose/N-acetylgalactosamine-specific phosphotransferase system component IIC
MTWAMIALLGGIAALDGSSFPQLMLSRPIVGATLTGLIFGRPVEGLVLGAVLELFALVILPIGAARYPEAGTAAVAATAAYLASAARGVDPALLVLAVLFALLWERIGGASVYLGRQLNQRIVEVPAAVADPAREFERRHLQALTVDFVRGAIIVTAGALVGTLALRVTGPLWGIPATTTLGVLGVAATAMLGATLPLFGGWSERKLALLFGLFCGSVLLFVR